MLALSLALVTLAIVEGNDWGWATASTLGAFAASAALLGGVVVRSLRHPRPIVEPALFRHRSFRIGNLGTLLFAAAFFSLILGNVLFLTGIWGYTVLQAGAATLPGPTLSTLVAGPAGRTVHARRPNLSRFQVAGNGGACAQAPLLLDEICQWSPPA